MSLTELAIKKAKPTSKNYVLTDSGGLFLLVTPTGGKLWRWRFQYQGKEQSYAIGKYPDISLARARELRNEARALVDQGKHPTREKKANKQRIAFNGRNTVKAVAMDWLELKHQNSNKKYKKLLEARLNKYVFPYLGNLPVDEVTTPDVVSVVEKIAAKGKIETAKRIGRIIAQVFRYVVRKGLRKDNPAADLRDIVPSKKTKHHACIHTNDLPDLLKAIDSYPGTPIEKMALQLLPLTFVRTKEFIGGRWDEIRWDKEEWHIPGHRMKMKRDHIVPLAKQSIALLKSLHELTGNREFIFFSARSKTKHICDGTFLVALKRMKYGGKMTGHGFRTLASTILNEATTSNNKRKYDKDYIEKQLAHDEKDDVRSPYNRAEYLPQRKIMMQDYADMLDAARRLPKPNILQFKTTSSNG